MKISAMFKDNLPGCEVGMVHRPAYFEAASHLFVEKASIDEMFIDFTKAVREVLLQRYPYLAQVPDEAPAGVDTPLPPPPPISWDGLGSLIPFEGDELLDVRKEDEVSFARKDEENGALEHLKVHNTVEPEEAQSAEELLTWHDVALSIAAELMQRARDEVRTNLGYSTSAVRGSLFISADSSRHRLHFKGIARNKFLAKVVLFCLDILLVE